MNRSQTSLIAIIITCLLGLMLLNVYWARFIDREETLYAWDHVAYWSMSLGLAEDLRDHPIDSLKEVSVSVWRDELNLLPSVPLAPALAFLGKSRKAYILCVLDVYCIPSLLIGFWCLLICTHNKEAWMIQLLAWISAILLLPAFWQPMALGYLGVGGMLPAFLILALSFDDRTEGSLKNNFPVYAPGWDAKTGSYFCASPQQKKVLQTLFLALALALLSFYRRWWIFWTLSFCIVWAGDVALRSFILFSKEQKHELRQLWKENILLGGATLTFLLILGGPRLYNIARTSYAGRFIHYKNHHGVAGAFTLLQSEFGILFLILLSLSWIFLFLDRRRRRVAIFLGAHSLVVSWLFFRVQDPSPQHWYLLMPAFLLIPAMAIGAMQQRLGKVLAFTAAFACLAIGLFLSWGVFGSSNTDRVLCPDIQIAPAQRKDLAEIKKLMSFLDQRLELQEGWIYVLSGTGKISDSGLGFINLSLGSHYRAPARILETQQIDLRDGFPRGLVAASYVLVPSPPQYRGDGLTQRVLQLPAEDFLNGKGIAAAFSKIGSEFSLEGGLKVQVFERIRANTPEEIQELSNRLKEFYPNQEAVWSPAGRLR